MEIKKGFMLRQSCRVFSPSQISDSELNYLIEAANAAPVSLGNYSDLKILVIQNENLLNEIEKFSSALMPTLGKHPLYGAKTIITVVGKKENTLMSGIPYCNASCVMENMILAATDLGLGNVFIYAVPALIQNSSELCEKLQISEGFFPVAMLAVGKPVSEINERNLTTDKIETQYIRG